MCVCVCVSGRGRDADHGLFSAQTLENNQIQFKQKKTFIKKKKKKVFMFMFMLQVPARSLHPRTGLQSQGLYGGFDPEGEV